MEVLWLAGGAAQQREVAEIGALLAREDGLLWVDIPECDAEALRVLSEVFRFHPLAIRDCLERSHIPKLHAYPDHLFLIVHAPEPGAAGQIHLLELDYFVGHRSLVTVHGPLNPEVPLENALRETRAVAKRLLDGRLSPASPAELSHAIVSALAARMETFVAELTRKVAGLERRVMRREGGDFEEALEEMFRVRHELLTLRTMTSACRELYARMSALRRFLPAEAQPFIEDLTDHFERVRSVCDSAARVPARRRRPVSVAHQREDEHRDGAAGADVGGNAAAHAARGYLRHERDRERPHADRGALGGARFDGQCRRRNPGLGAQAGLVVAAAFASAGN